MPYNPYRNYPFWDDDEDDYTETPAQQVYSLRREGELDAAFETARQFIQAGDHSREIFIAYAWVLVDLCKRERENGNTEFVNNTIASLRGCNLDTNDEFENNLKRKIDRLYIENDPYYPRILQAKQLSREGNNMGALEIFTSLNNEGHLPNDKEIHESYGWIIYRSLRDNVDSLTSVQVRSYLRDYILLSNVRPSNLHSQILNFALKYSEKDDQFKFINFLILWGPENLRGEDFRDSIGQDMKRIPSLMQRIARVVVKYPSNEIQRFLDILPSGKDLFIDMLRQCLFWDLYHLSENKSSEIWPLFDSYTKGYSKYAGSEWHSKVLWLAERTMEGNESWRFYSFFKSWRPNRLREEDWNPETDNDGNEYSPLAVKAIKKATESLDSPQNQDINSPEDLKWLMGLYEKAVIKFPDDDWTIRSKAMLHLKVGQKDKAEEIYIDLAKRLGDKYFIWQEFAQCTDDPNLKAAMLCKAISLEKNEDFIGKIRIELAELLLAEGKKEHAELELRTVKEHYQKKGWSIKQPVYDMLSLCDGISNRRRSNEDYYKSMIPIAEEHAYSNLPFTEMVLLDIWKDPNTQKRMMKFVDGNSNEIVINQKKFAELNSAVPGEVWKIKLFERKVTTPVKTHTPPNSSGGIRRPVTRQAPSTTTKTETKLNPVSVAKSDTCISNVLADVYGIVDFVNKEDSFYNIHSQDSTLIRKRYSGESPFPKGTFVKFNMYTSKAGEGKKDKQYAFNLMVCTKEEAIPHFKTRIVVVDGVNENKQLFHYVLGPGLLSGVIFYRQTDIRPKVGECLKLTYYIRKRLNKEINKEERFIEPIEISPTDEVNNELVKNVSGFIEFPRNGSFGFVDGCFIPPYLLKENGIYNDEFMEYYVTGTAICEKEGKWKVIRLYKDNAKDGDE